MKLVSVVVLYHPDDEVYENIASYAKGCEATIVWDNTPRTEKLTTEWWREKLSLSEEVNLYYVSEGSNRGLAYAYNRAIEKAIELGGTHIMTMDQDSRFEGFDCFRAEVELKEKDNSLFCPPINNRETKRGEQVRVSYAAQSGCVHSLEMIKKIGGFREDFFIGMVDVEMQLKAVEHGYDIVQIGGCNLIHQVGSGRKVHCGGKEVLVSDYSPLRHYYDSRNRILMWREFPNDYDWKGKMKFFVSRMKLCMKILLYEDRKFAKVGAIIRGTWNGAWNRIIPF